MTMTDAELLASIEPAPAEEGAKDETTNAPADATPAEAQAGTEEATQATVEAGNEAGTENNEADGQPESYTVKVDGEDLQVSMDELLKGYSTNKAAQQKFNDASMARKQAEEFIHLLKTNPLQVLQSPELGIDMRGISEQYLADQLNFEQLTDEQRELLTAKQQLAQFEQDKQSRAQAEHDANVERLAEEYNVEYTKRIDTALTEASLPITQDTIRRMASYMSEALGSDDPAIRSLSDKDIVELVREDYTNDIKTMLGKSDVETLTNMLGSDISTTLRKADIAKIAGKPLVTGKPVKGNTHVKEDDKTMNNDQWNDFLDNYS